MWQSFSIYQNNLLNCICFIIFYLVGFRGGSVWQAETSFWIPYWKFLLSVQNSSSDARCCSTLAWGAESIKGILMSSYAIIFLGFNQIWDPLNDQVKKIIIWNRFSQIFDFDLVISSVSILFLLYTVFSKTASLHGQFNWFWKVLSKV